jgi:hypothetical protein
MATKKSGPRKQGESMAAQQADTLAAQERAKLWRPISTWDFMDQNAFVTWFHPVGIFPKHCNVASLLDVAGSSRTGDDGTTVLRLSNWACMENRLLEPANVVATPQSATPCYVTILHTLVDDAMDLEIGVFTWDAGGAPAPGVAFDWRCRVPYSVIIL